MRRKLRETLLTAPSMLWLVGLFLVPTLLVFVLAFRPADPFGGIGAGWTMENLRALGRSYYLAIAFRTLWVSLLTTAVSILLALPAGYAVARASERRRRILLMLIIVPFWTSFLIRTYAWMFLLRTEGLVNRALMGTGIVGQPIELLYNNFAVLIGLVYGELPFMILPLFASLEKLDLSLLEASQDLGAGRAATFRRVTVPLTMPGIVAGVILVFVPSLGQFIVSDLLGGAKTILAGNLIQNQFAVARNKPFGAAVAFELTAAVLALLFAYTIYTKRKGQDVLL
jgi:spermidine/putrescine transport system permease protein